MKKPDPIDWAEWNRMCDAFGKAQRSGVMEFASGFAQLLNRTVFRTLQHVWELAKQDEREHGKKPRRR